MIPSLDFRCNYNIGVGLYLVLWVNGTSLVGKIGGSLIRFRLVVANKLFVTDKVCILINLLIWMKFESVF